MRNVGRGEGVEPSLFGFGASSMEFRSFWAEPRPDLRMAILVTTEENMAKIWLVRLFAADEVELRMMWCF